MEINENSVLPLAERTRCPAHPGKVLKGLQLEPRGISITAFAAHIGISRNVLSNIINGKAPVTADMAVRFAKALDTDADIWLSMQKTYDLWHSLHSDVADQISKLSASP